MKTPQVCYNGGMNIEVLNFLCVHVCHAAAYAVLSEYRWRWWTVALVWALYVAVAMASTLALFVIFPRGAKWTIFAVTVALHAALYFWGAEGSAWRRCFNLASYLTFFFFSVPLVHWFAWLCFGHTVIVHELWRIPLYAALVALWRIRWRGMFDRATTGITDGWRVLAVFAFLMCAGVSVLTLIIFPAEFSTYRVNVAEVRGTLCTLVIVVAAYIMLFRTISLLRGAHEAAQLRAAKWLLESELSAEKDFVSQAQRHRHDLRHHNRLLFSLAEAGDLVGIKHYLAEYETSLDDASLGAYCRHPVLNALLCNFARRCDDAGIRCDIHAGLPEQLPLSDVDVCTVFGNVLENALVACRQCDEPYFLLDAAVKGGGLCVEARNSARGVVRFKDGLPMTTRLGGGIGTRSIQETVARYGGLVEFTVTDAQNGAEFCVRIILPLTSRCDDGRASDDRWNDGGGVLMTKIF